jgi:hypothetical protein
MNDFNRRDALKVGAGAAAAAATAGEALAQQQTRPAAVGAYPVRPEPNAQIRLLRWSRFVEGEERHISRNVAPVHRAHPRPGPRRQRLVRGHPAQGGGRRQCRPRARHHPRLVRRRPPVIPTGSST